MASEDSSLDMLYDFVQRRPRPEDVAWHIMHVTLKGNLSGREKQVIGRAAAGSYGQMVGMYSSMAADFFKHTTQIDQNAKSAATLFEVEVPECEPEALKAWIAAVGGKIHRALGTSMKDRLGHAERRSLGLYKNARWYNKRYRVLCRLEAKLVSIAYERKKYEFTRIGKSGFATTITRERFVEDANTACLVAYMAARMSMRSTFTNGSQVRAFDEIAKMLLQRCEDNADTTRWDLVACVLPDAQVMRRCYDAQKGEILARAWNALSDVASILELVWRRSEFDRASMIVSRGNDSSTWNQMAGAWNKARDVWVQTLYALGMESVLDEICVGKVMRLIAADVAHWHRASGGAVHPDTAVWAALPAPWDVLSGSAQCTREMVEAACKASSVNPDAWTGRRASREAVEFTETPELVHGVAVSSPSLALALRKAGVFSGKGIKGDGPPVQVDRDEHGFALLAHS